MAFPALLSTAAVLLYRVIELWVPAILGAVAFVQLRRLLRREAESIDLCQPGEIVEIVGRGPVVANPPVEGAASTLGNTGEEA